MAHTYDKVGNLKTKGACPTINILTGAGVIVQDEGVTLASEPAINFIGLGIIAEDDAPNSRINITAYDIISTDTVDIVYDDTLKQISPNVKFSNLACNAMLVGPDGGLYVKNFDNTYLVFGGDVTWTGPNYDYDISAGALFLNCDYCEFDDTSISLAPADPTYSRVDVIAVRQSSPNCEVVVLQGTPALLPQEPFVDTTLYLKLTAILVAAGTTAPVQNECMYLNNAEWTTVSGQASIDPDSIITPDTGAKVIEGTSVANGDYVTLTNGSSIVPRNWTNLQFRIKSKGNFDVTSTTTGIYFQWTLSGTPIGVPVLLQNGSYGFDSVPTSAYQTVKIPTPDFGITTLDVADGFIITGFSTSAITNGWFIDNICLISVPYVSPIIPSLTFRNGLTRTGNIVELGGTLFHNTELFTYYNKLTVTGHRAYDSVFDTEQTQSWEISTDIQAWHHVGSNVPTDASYYTHAKKRTSYNSDAYHAEIDYPSYFGAVGERAGYYDSVNLHGGGSYGTFRDSTTSKWAAQFWHTHDTGNTELITWFGGANGSSSLAVTGAGQHLGSSSIFSLHTDYHLQAHKYGVGTFLDNASPYLLAVDASGNLTEFDPSTITTVESDPIALAKTLTLTQGGAITVTNSGVAQALSTNPSWTIAHADTSSVSNLDTSGAQVIDLLSVDTYGHVTTLTTRNLTASDIGAITGITADNGLTANTATNVQLGGTLTGHTTIAEANFDLIFSQGRILFKDLALSSNPTAIFGNPASTYGLLQLYNSVGNQVAHLQPGLLILQGDEFNNELRFASGDATKNISIVPPTDLLWLSANQTFRLADTGSATTRVLPISVNGNYANSAGNITISIGTDTNFATNDLTATGNRTHTFAANTAEITYNSLAGSSGFKLSSTSTAAASNVQKLFEIALSGANATTTQTTYGGYITNIHTGTSSTNIGLYLSASGGNNNYPLVVPAGGGTVGFGTITPGSNSRVVIQSAGDAYALEVDNSNGIAIYGSSTNSDAYNANVSGAGYVFNGSATPSSGAAVTSIMKLTNQPSGALSNNYGAAIDVYLKASDASIYQASQLITKFTDKTFGTRTAQFVLNLVNSGTVQNKLVIGGNGATRLVDYGVGAFTGTDAYWLAVDSSGNLIEMAAPGGGGYTNLTQFVAQNNWKVFYSDGSGDVQELALGASGTVLTSNGTTSAPTFTSATVNYIGAMQVLASGDGGSYIGRTSGPGDDGSSAGTSTNQANVILGDRAGSSLTTGKYNTFLGLHAGHSVASGNDNFFAGWDAGYNTTGSANIALPQDALYSNVSGSNNIAMGRGAGYSSTTSDNIYMGYSAGYYLTGGSATENIIIGNYAASSSGTTSFGQSIFIGVYAGENANAASDCVIIGYEAAFSGGGSKGVGLGRGTLYNATGTGNIGIGYRAGDALTSGTKNIVIGYDIDAQSNTATGQLTIGNAIIGTFTPTTGTTVATSVKIGIGVTPSAHLHLVAGSATAGTAPLKIASGTVLGTTEGGAIENDGTHLYYTAADAGTRFQLDQQGGSGEVNTASNLGGGLANYSTKVGVDLQFNSFSSSNFDLTSNLISIKAGGVGSSEIASGVTLAGNPTTTTQTSTDNSTKIATTSYVTTAVANAIAAVNPAMAVEAATTGNLPNSPTYSNGVSGIGATITAGVTNTALVVDGYTPILLDRILVKDETGGLGAAKQGVYYVSQVAAVGLAWILTRALDYDQPSGMNNTGSIPVINGTVNTTTSWVQSSTVTTVGTDAVTFTQFSYAPSTLITTSTTAGGDLSGTFSNLQIVAGAIVNADINASAAIAYSKLALTGAILNADLAGSIAASKLVKTDITSIGDLTVGSIGTGFVVKGVTMTLGSDATNDMYYRNSSGVLTRFASANNGVLITSSGGVPSISTTIPNATQDNITRLGTIAVGVWNGTAIANANLANSTISGIALGSNLGTLTFGTHLTSGGSSYNGSAGVTITSDATSAATASTIVSRDASANVFNNNVILNYRTTATAAGTTTLVVGDAHIQYFTGSTTQIVKLPVVSGLATGFQYEIDNLSTGAVTVQSSGGNAILILAGGTSAIFTCISTSGTDATSWNAWYGGTSTTTGKILTVSNTVTLTATDGSTLAIGAGGTLGSNAYTSTAYVPTSTTVAGFALSGNITLAALTATNTTLTFSGSYDGSTARTVGINLATANTWTGAITNTAAAPQIILGVDTTTAGKIKLFGVTSGDATIKTTDAAGTATVVTLPNSSSTLPIFTQQITFSGPTAARTITLPDAAFTVARTDAANTFTGVQTFSSAPVLSTGTVTVSSNTITFPAAAGTLATLAGTEELTGKTLNASVAKGTWTASGTWTIPAVTLGGTVSGGGNNINNVIIGATTPLAGSFTLVTASKAGLSLDVTNSTDAVTNQIAKWSGTNATRAANDLIYESFFLASSTGVQREFVRVSYKAPVVTNTSEDGSMIISVMSAGTLTDSLILTKTDLKPVTSDLLSLGTSALMWSDLFLASGAVINFNNGNVVMTHTAGILTMGTGEMRITTVGTNTASVVTVGGTQTLTGKTLTTPIISSISNTGTITLPTATDTLVGRATTDTLTNKRKQPRVSSAANNTSLTPEIDTFDIYHLTAMTGATTINNHSTSTPADGEILELRFLDNGTARALTWGTNYVAKAGVVLPTTTVLSKNLCLLFEWNSNLSKFNLMASGAEA